MKVLKLLVILFLIMGLSKRRAQADFIFGEAVKVPNINTEFLDKGPSLSANGLELYFHSMRPNAAGLPLSNIWFSKRSTIGESWSVPVMLDPPVNSLWSESSPCLSADGLELYFTDGWVPTGPPPNPGGYGGGDLWVSRRTSKEDPWSDPENLGPTVNSEFCEDFPSIAADGLSLYFASNRSGGFGRTDIWVTKRQTKNDPWSTPVLLSNHINTNSYEASPNISPDGLSLFFSRGYPNAQIYICRRAKTTDPWGTRSKFRTR